MRKARGILVIIRKKGWTEGGRVRACELVGCDAASLLDGRVRSRRWQVNFGAGSSGCRVATKLKALEFFSEP